MINIIRIILILILAFPFYGYGAESEEIVKRPSRPYIPHIYLEEEKIVAYFEVARIQEYQKLIPSVFSMPEKPVCRVQVIDYYKMESAPPYLESMIDVLVKYKSPQSKQEILAWYCLEMPVTTEDALWGRFLGGFPKVVRKVTFESYANRDIGTSYAPDGKTPKFKLTLELKKSKLASDEKRFLDFISPAYFLTIMNGKVLNWGRVNNKIYELEKAAPKIWKINFGDCTIDYPDEAKNYLYRLGVGKIITGYWLKQKVRSSLKSTVE